MNEPRNAEIRQVVNRFAWGEALVTTVLDGAQVQQPLRPPFALDKDDDELARIGRASRLPSDRFENSFTPTIVELGGELVLFDTGFGAAGHDKNSGFLRERMASAGYRPEDITVLAFTHMHPDHILGFSEDGELCFPNAKLFMGRVEFEEWNSGANIPPQRAKTREIFLDRVAPFAERFTFLEDEQDVVPGLTAMAAFGHSPGHMMYRVESGGKSLLIWGDVTNHYVYSLQYPDSPVGFDDHKDQAILTRHRVLDMVSNEDLLVSGHHMPFPAVGYVEKAGDSYRWVPATYQFRV